jgi:hypothetical protein
MNVNKRMEMMEEFYRTLNQWMTLIEKGENIDGVISSVGNVHEIAIYGMGDMARHIMVALKETDIRIVCVLDNNEYECYDGIEITKIENCSKKVDLVIYTNPLEEDLVIEKLKTKFGCPVIGLSDIVFNNLRL